MWVPKWWRYALALLFAAAVSLGAAALFGAFTPAASGASSPTPAPPQASVAPTPAG